MVGNSLALIQRLDGRVLQFWLINIFMLEEFGGLTLRLEEKQKQAFYSR